MTKALPLPALMTRTDLAVRAVEWIGFDPFLDVKTASREEYAALHAAYVGALRAWRDEHYGAALPRAEYLREIWVPTMRVWTTENGAELAVVPGTAQGAVVWANGDRAQGTWNADRSALHCAFGLRVSREGARLA